MAKPTVSELTDAMENIRQFLRDDMHERITQEMRNYRESYIRCADKWCCNEMAQFARKAWNMPTPGNPINEAFFGGVRLELLHHPVVYCPFCGVKL